MNAPGNARPRLTGAGREGGLLACCSSSNYSEVQGGGGGGRFIAAAAQRYRKGEVYWHVIVAAATQVGLL